ncbi:hypothetical protein BHM03_00035403, partial [Ensete ventricosum]
CTLLIEITFPAVTSSSSSFLFVFAFAPEECPRGFFRSSPEAPDPITMASANAPIAMREALTLPSLGINPQFITFTHVTMESDKYICVRETAPQNSLVIIDMSMPMQPLRRPITADSALMNPDAKILALKGFFFLLNDLLFVMAAGKENPSTLVCYRYADRPLSGGTAKIDRLRSIEGEKGKKKKRKRRKKKRRRNTSRRPRPHAVAARG